MAAGLDGSPGDLWSGFTSFIKVYGSANHRRASRHDGDRSGEWSPSATA